jgi:hypothetical protein
VRRGRRHLGCPQDIEWALRDGTLWFLQARPITAIPEPKPWEDRQVWTNLNLGEVAPDVMTPMTYAVIMLMFEPLWGPVFRFFGVADVHKNPPAGLVAGRVYFNINTMLAAARCLLPAWLAAERYLRRRQTSGSRLEFDLCEDVPDLGFRWPGTSSPGGAGSRPDCPPTQPRRCVHGGFRPTTTPWRAARRDHGGRPGW